MIVLKKILPVIILAALVSVFFWKVLLKGMVPFPGDLLIGAYYPWLEYKWGFVAGVPVKNGLISDVFSEIYIWKYLVAESFKLGQWPLWNPHVFSGFPLLAAFSGGALYFLNLLMLFGPHGWSAMVIIQVLGTGIPMYWFLSQREFSKTASLAGAIAFAFSASMMIRLEWNSAGHVMMWTTVMMSVIETYFRKTRRAAVLLPLIIFLSVTAGHFQTMLYGFVLVGSYAIFRAVEAKKVKRLLELGIYAIFGLIISSVQLLPTANLMKKSVRFVEAAAAQDNYGLLPLNKLITMLAPDFYGNPGTGNYWGFLNYSETIFYPGILGIIALLWAGLNTKKLSRFSKFFFWLSIVSIILAFDNPIGKLVYEFKVPFLSTGYAARIAVLLMFSTATLISTWVDRFSKMKIKEAILPLIILAGAAVIGYCVSEYGRSVFMIDSELMSDWLKRMVVIKRNLILPSLLILGITGLIVLRKWSMAKYLIILIVVADLFRFGWKYNPFVVKEWVYPDTEVTSFLSTQPGLFRVESQKGPVLPANTWTMYGLYSASGYDPLQGKDYASEYSRVLNRGNSATRYSTLEKYNSQDLGEFNVKYLLIDKEFPGLYENGLRRWKLAFDTEKISVYENPDFKERIEWQGEGQGEVKALTYSPNKISLSYFSAGNGEIIIRDSWDEGWKARVNGQSQEIEKYNYIFKKIKVPFGSGEIEMLYAPDEWNTGGKLALIGLAGWIIMGMYTIKRYE